MLYYYFKIGLHNLRRNTVLTSLMIITLAVGIAASISTLTILRMMSRDPIPLKSTLLLVPIIDNGSLSDYRPTDRSEARLMTYRDTVNFLNSDWGVNRTAIYSIQRGLEFSLPDNRGLRQLSNIDGIATTRSYFSMFDVPFKYGSAWQAEEENKHANVAVLSQKTSAKLFGGANPVGRSIRLGQDGFRVVGVVGNWNPIPRYTNVLLSDDQYVGEEEIYIPFQTAIADQIDPYAGFECGGSLPEPGFQGQLDTECTWIQFWFEANSATQINQIKTELDNYTRQQNRLGRFTRMAKNKLLNVMEWLDCLELVDGSYKIATGLSFAFLMLCMVNTIGLLLAKFSSRATEVGVRRALGASKQDIFAQFLIETTVIGLAGGLLGLILSFAALWIIAQQTKQFMVVAHMDVQMMLITFVLSVLSSVLAGLFPIWRACQITPAIQLKTH